MSDHVFLLHGDALRERVHAHAHARVHGRALPRDRDHESGHDRRQRFPVQSARCRRSMSRTGSVGRAQTRSGCAAHTLRGQ